MNSLFQCLYGQSEFLHCSDTDNDADKDRQFYHKDESFSSSSKSCSLKKSFDFPSSDNLSCSTTTDKDDSDTDNEFVESNTYFEASKDASYFGYSESNSFEKSKFYSQCLSNSQALEKHSVENDKRVNAAIGINNWDVRKIMENNKFADASNFQNTPSRKRSFSSSQNFSYSRELGYFVDKSKQSVDYRNESVRFNSNLHKPSKSSEAKPTYKSNKKNRKKSRPKKDSIMIPFKAKCAFISGKRTSAACYEEKPFFECPTYCTLCNNDFKKKITFLLHLKGEHGLSKSDNLRYANQRTPLSCSLCYFVSNDVIKFICHLNIHTVLVSCRICREHCQTLVEYERHRLTSNCGKLYKCCICQEITKHYRFEKHTRKKHKTFSYSSQCAISFSSDNELTLHCYENHQLTMDDLDSFSLCRILPKRQCVYCALFVADASFLPKHVINSHNCWDCKVCGALLAHSDLAIRHSYSHTDTLTILDKSVKGSLVDRNQINPIRVPEMVNHTFAERTKETLETSSDTKESNSATSLSFEEVNAKILVNSKSMQR